MTAFTPADIEARPIGATVYIQHPGHRFPLRYTRTTDTHWKRTDGLADGRTWATHQELADIAAQGIVTNPFTGGTP